MDIHGWLARTADREPPDEEHRPGFPEFLEPRKEPEETSRRYRRKRKRASSDSSLIEAHRSHHKRAPSTGRAHSSDAVPVPHLSAVRQHGRWRERSWHSPDASHPVEKAAPAKTYERRARHKTRADRYEPKSRKHNREREMREDQDPKPRRRKSHRSADGGRTTGLVQSFQLKNGPKNSRLTMKPELAAGLFKHGRASAQVAGRGAGLPDLAFNEMRFLQQPKENQDELATNEKESTTKKDRSRRHGEEVSAYFNIQRKPHDDGAENANHRILARQAEPQREVEKQATVPPPVELPGRPFLGFGSRGDQPAAKATVTSNSYYTWSESVRQEHEQPKTHTTAKMHAENPLEAASECQSHDYLNREPALGGGGRGHRPPRRQHQEQVPAITSKTSRSPSRYMPSEPPVRLRPSGSPSSDFHTSGILHIRLAKLAQPDLLTEHQRYEAHDTISNAEKEDRDPEPSTPLSKLLRQAQQAAGLPGPDTQHTEDVNHPPAREAVPPMRAATGLHERRLESVSGLRRNTTAAAPVRMYHGRTLSSRGAWPVFDQLAPRRPTSKEEILDYRPDLGYVYANAEQAEALANAMSDHAPPLLYSPAMQPLSEQASSRISNHLLVRRTPSMRGLPNQSLSEQAGSRASNRLPVGQTPSMRGLSNREDFQSERSLLMMGEEQRRETSEDFAAGFWKPNRLY